MASSLNGTTARKIYRDLWSNKARTALVSLAVFVGVWGVVILFTMSQLLLAQLHKTIKPDQIAMVNVLVTVNNLSRLNDDQYLAQLRGFEGVTAVQGSTQGSFQFSLDLGGSSTLYEANLLSFSEPFSEEVPFIIEPLTLLEGHYPQQGQQQLAVEKRFAERYKLAVNDPLYVRVVKRPSLLSTAVVEVFEEWMISGIVFHPYVLSPANTAYATLADNHYLTGTRGYNVFSARFENYGLAHRQARLFGSEISQISPYLPIYTQRQDPIYNPLLVGAERLAQTMNTLALMALFVSAFLVINIISSLIGEHRQQIGALKALGATRLNIILMYGGLALAYGLLGTIPAVLLGIPCGYWLADALALQVNTYLEGFSIAWQAVLIGIASGLATPLLAASLPIWRSTQVSILEAMSDSGIKATYGNTRGLSTLFHALPLPLVLRQTLRNLTQRKGRLILTILTLAIAVGAFMGIFALASSIKAALQHFLSNTDGNILLYTNAQEDPDYMLGLLEAYVRQNPEAALEIASGFQLPIEITGYDDPLINLTEGTTHLTAYSLNAAQSQLPLDIQLIEGELPTDNQVGMVLPLTVANQLDKGVGDTVEVTILGQSTPVVITGISDTPLEQVWLPLPTLLTLAGYEDFLPVLDNYVSYVDVMGQSAEALLPQVMVLGLPPDAQLWLDVDESQLQSQEVIVTRELADQEGYQVGDSITLRYGQDSQSYQIVEIADLPTANTLLPSQLIGMAWESLADLEDRQLEDLPLPRTYYLTYADQVEQALGEDWLTDLRDRLLEAGIPTSLFNFVGLLEALSQNLNLFQAMLSLVALLIGVVGALGLLSTLSMSVHERQREIGVMRSVGATSAAIMGQFMIEGLLIGLIAWAIGVPMSLAFSQVLLDATGLAEQINLGFSLQAVGLGLAGMLLLTAFASLLPAWSASQRTVSDILRYR